MSYEVSEEPDLISDLGIGQFNTTQSIEDMKLDKNMVWLLLSLISSIVWVVYITFYNSRVFGYFITKLVNRLFIKGVPRTSKGITDLLSLNLILLNTNCPIKQIVNLDELTYYQVTLHRRWTERAHDRANGPDAPTRPTVSTSDC